MNVGPPPHRGRALRGGAGPAAGRAGRAPRARCGAMRRCATRSLELLRLSRASAPDFGLPSDAFRQAAMQSAGHAPAPDTHQRERDAGGERDVEGEGDSASQGRTEVIGERIGGWRVLREIGRGGMGAVYLVERVGVEFAQRGALKLVEGSGRARRRPSAIGTRTAHSGVAQSSAHRAAARRRTRAMAGRIS